MTSYITIRPDALYSSDSPAEPLVEHLRTFTELVQVGPMQFQNAPGNPWVRLELAMADKAGNYAADEAFHAQINLVEMACGAGNDLWYDPLAVRIATFLDWEAVDEHGDHLYPPA